MDQEPELTKEPLDYEFTHRAQRNYKDKFFDVKL